jgi:hypothetical protein
MAIKMEFIVAGPGQYEKKCRSSFDAHFSGVDVVADREFLRR